MKKIKKFVLTISERFPSTHFMKGEETGFVEKILQKIKIHTIRKNYPLWKKRIEQVQKGEAILSIRVWTGTPYKSPQKEIIQLNQSSGIGVQPIYIDFVNQWFETPLDDNEKDFYYHTTKDLSKNDGLSEDDFEKWFKGTSLDEKLVIIHFTKFRY